MKRISKLLLAMLACATLSVAFTACNNQNESTSSSDSSVATSVSGNITLNKTTATMDLYETMTLTATLEGVTGDVVWSSSDPTKATVENGVVTSIAAGEVTVTATVGEVSATCVVTIASSGQVPVLSIGDESMNLTQGSDFTITPALTYKGQAVEATYTYASTAPTVATVENGVIVAVGSGSTTITVTASYLGFQTSKQINVTVMANVSFETNENEVVLGAVEVGEYVTSQTIITSVYENDVVVTDPVIVWASQDGTVATVEEGVITAVGVGETTVSATYTSTDGEDFTVFVTVVVERPVVNGKLTNSAIDIGAVEGDTMAFDLSGLEANGELVKISDATGDGEAVEIPFTMEGGKVVAAKADVLSGERKLVIEYEKIAYNVTVKMADKVITKAEELLNLKSYSPNVTTVTWSYGDRTKTGDCYDGYFVLGNNITLGTTMVSYLTEEGDPVRAMWDDGPGFSGTFDGNGYSIIGGVYGKGGLFGYLTETSVIKNVAFVNLTIGQSDLAKPYFDSASAVLSVSAWGKISDVLIQVNEIYTRAPQFGFDGEWGVVAMNVGHSFKTTNLIIYDDSTTTVHNRASFYSSPAAKEWTIVSDTTYVFTNGNIYYINRHSGWAEGYPLTAIARDKTLTEAAVEVSAFGDIWDMTGDRARFKSSEVDLTGENKAQFDMSGETFEVTLSELKGKTVEFASVNGQEFSFTQNETTLTFNAESYKEAATQHGVVTIDIIAGCAAYKFNVLNVTKVITKAEELLNLKSYSPNVTSVTWSYGDRTANGDCYDGYFVLGNNITLDTTMVSYLSEEGDPVRAMWNDEPGFAGTFDGQGYSIIGGVYGKGGLFGYLTRTSVIKNVAFVNLTIGQSDLAKPYFDSASAVLSVSAWGKISDVLIQVNEIYTRAPQFGFDGEWGVVAMNVGHSFKTTNLIIYDDSTTTVHNRASFYSAPSIGEWAIVSNTTYVFTNGNIYYKGRHSGSSAGHPLTAIAKDKTLTEAEVEVSAFGDIWDMTGDRATFKSLNA